MLSWSIWKSRTFWSTVVLAVYNILVAAGSIYVSPILTDGVNVLGLVLISYFHVNPSQQYNTGSINK